MILSLTSAWNAAPTTQQFVSYFNATIFFISDSQLFLLPSLNMMIREYLPMFFPLLLLPFSYSIIFSCTHSLWNMPHSSKISSYAFVVSLFWKYDTFFSLLPCITQTKEGSPAELLLVDRNDNIVEKFPVSTWRFDLFFQHLNSQFSLLLSSLAQRN